LLLVPRSGCTNTNWTISPQRLNMSRYTRQLFVEREQLAGQARTLDADWRRLQLARSASARAARVDEIARGALKMRPITPEHTLYVSASTPVVPAAGGGR